MSRSGPPAYARVAIARPLDDLLTYAIPAYLSGDVRVGHVVLVPFGSKGAETGYVVELADEPGFDPAKIKAITRLVDPEPGFDARQLEFFRWIAAYYLAPLGLVIHTALPSGIQARVVRVLEPTDDGLQALVRAEAEDDLAHVLREVIARPGLTRKGLVRRLEADLGDRADKAIDALLRRDWVSWGEREVQETKGRVRTVALAVPLADAVARLPKRAARLHAVVEALARAGGPVDQRAIVADQGSTAGPALRRLAEEGLVRFGEREDRDALVEDVPLGPARPPVLNADQQRALEAIASEAKPWLLFGVTGSGKTEVFLGAAKATLERGRQVLVLVPEIGLTPQLVGRFKARFGERIAVLHSGLSGGERLAEWRRIRAGEADVAIGARSALFAPFRDLGLVVVDEEHDDSYKQDDGVRYHARDLAVVLGRMQACPVVLASATPSLESWSNAQQGRYGLLRLPNRATPAAVPTVELFDLTQMDAPDGAPRPLFHPDVVEGVRAALADGGKAIVLYNRRGYATMVQCLSCGGTYECPNCGITMTLHRNARVMACHYCAMRVPYDGRCPACHGADLEELGKGTERIAEELERLFPHAPLARMDADTTAVRGAHHKILERFRSGRARILVGTQIVAKGHDFPDVAVAVVVSADHGFRLPDFRAAERTWALLVQVAGRAGRGERPGRVLVQTWTPDHYVLSHLDRVEGFYEAEQRIRATLRYPPTSRLCLLRLDGADRRRVQEVAGELGRELRSLGRGFPRVDLLGPAPAALPRVAGRWRWQIVLRGGDVRAFRAWLDACAPAIRGADGRGVRVSADVDPRHLM